MLVYEYECGPVDYTLGFLGVREYIKNLMLGWNEETPEGFAFIIRKIRVITELLCFAMKKAGMYSDYRQPPLICNFPHKYMWESATDPAICVMIKVDNNGTTYFFSTAELYGMREELVTVHTL